ncbi:cache domain-containing sensor histidine kinase [Paenibacillus xanthanilyticus]|uniref:Sensor histidine kinase n=1 Tax=Paenibacillus xanthanilyticus TaxID=1783531 RepID=A0ABV8K6D4_9BACL
MKVMLRSQRPRSIHANLSLAFVLLILVTVLVMSIISYYLSKDAVQDATQAYTTEFMKQVNANMKTYVSGMEHIAGLVAGSRQVHDYLSADRYPTLDEEKKAREGVYEYLHAMVATRNDIVSVSLFGEDGRFVSGSRELEVNPFVELRELNWYKQAKAAKGANVISSSHVQPIFLDRHVWVVSMSRALYSKENGEPLGVFLVDLNFSVMNDMFADIQLGSRGYLFVVDNSGKLVYHPQQQLVYSGLKTEQIDKVLQVGSGSFLIGEGSARRMYTVQDSGFGWKLVGVSYVSELVGNKERMGMSFFALGAVCILVSIVLSVILSNRLIRPITQLQRYMKEVEKGNFDIQVPVPFSIEIGRLARAFNLMVERIKELMVRVVREEELKRTSELNALQMQINPHFLYNTLDSIVWMAESGKDQEVVLMTSSLAKLFRASIGKGEELVTVQTELDHIAHYLTIQKMRYKRKLDYVIEADESILDCLTIRVVLQPLVENAIYHGIKNKRGPGMIRITASENGGDVTLRVEDDGIGIDGARMRALLEGSDASGPKGGVGVRNVHERLRLQFGGRYGLSFDGELGQGTVATVRIPQRTRGKEETR